jgi:hypothetical protein
MKLIAVIHDNKPLSKCGRKGGVNKPETFSSTYVSITQHEENSPRCCQFRVAEITSVGHVLCWENLSTSEDEDYTSTYVCAHASMCTR